MTIGDTGAGAWEGRADWSTSEAEQMKGSEETHRGRQGEGLQTVGAEE